MGGRSCGAVKACLALAPPMAEIAATLFAHQPRPHIQCLGELCFSWYALGEGDRPTIPLPVELTIGPDLARSLHAFWPTLESHAEHIDRLCRNKRDAF